jgi:nicotinamide riboside transporter PnuC
MFVSQHLYATALLYGAFLVLAVMGFVEWRRSIATGAHA